MAWLACVLLLIASSRVVLSGWVPAGAGGRRMLLLEEQVSKQAQNQQAAHPASGAGLPRPLYSAVLGWEEQQEPESRGPCPIDRLLVMEAGPGLDNLLLMLQAGLTLARFTRRTLVIPSLESLVRHPLALAAILDTRELNLFWHCYIEVDELRRQAKLLEEERPHGEEPSPSPPPLAHMYHLLRQDLDSGSFLSWEGQEAGATVQAYADWVWQTPAAGSARTLLVRRHLAGQMCGGEGAWEEAFWRRVRPSAAVAAEVAAVRRQRLGQGPYAAVHAGRGLAGYCHRFVSSRFAPGALQDGVRTTCALNATLLRQIFASSGWKEGALPGGVFVATEPWAEERHRLPRGALPWPGAATYDQPSLPVHGKAFGRRPREMVQGAEAEQVYAPAVELFLMAGADVAVGSLASRMAVIAANLRAARMKRTVLAWPEPTQPSSTYWECRRYQYCGEQYIDALGLRRRRSVCYPSQAP